MRRIQILLVEKGSCFSLWREIIDNLSRYESRDPNHLFQTMHLSNDHTKKVGFSFDCEKAATSFFGTVLSLTSDPHNIALSSPNDDKKMKKKAKKVLPKTKSDISTPCGFQHVVNVGKQDTEKYFSMQAYVTSPRQKHGTLRPKLSVYSSCADLNC